MRKTFFLTSIRIKRGDLIFRETRTLGREGSEWEGRTQRQNVGQLWKLPPFIAGKSMRSTPSRYWSLINY